MKKNTNRQLTAIFCDDIRNEAGNKTSFMGCYQGELFVPAVPIGLSKLCVYASAWTLKDNPFKSLTFRVVLDKDIELARLEIPLQALAEAAQITDETANRQNVNTAIVFSPFFIEKPAMLRLMAETEEGEIVGPRILFKVAPELALTVQQPKRAKPEEPKTVKKLTKKKAGVSPST